MTSHPPTAEQSAAAMREGLAALLDEVPLSRGVLPHLAMLERSLKNHGLRGITKLPEAVLVKAHAQLASLPLQAEHEALAQLLCLLELSQKPGHPAGHPAGRDDDAEHGGDARDPGPTGQFLSSFLSDDKLEVSDATHSDFQRALDEQARRA